MSTARIANPDGNTYKLAPGPFKITVLYCGTFTKAIQRKYRNLMLSSPRSPAHYGGLIFRYTNVSNGITDYPLLAVNFVRGNSAVGDSVNGSAPKISPGQSAVIGVDAVGVSGKSLRFATCEPLTYTISQGVGPYAP